MELLTKLYLIGISWSAVAILNPLASFPNILMGLSMIMFGLKPDFNRLKKYALENKALILLLIYLTFNTFILKGKITYLLVYFVSILGHYIFMDHVIVKKTPLKEIIKYIAIGVIITSIFSLVETNLSLFYHFNLRKILNLTTADLGSGYLQHYLRAYGFSNEPTYLGMYLISFIPLLFAKEFRNSFTNSKFLIMLIISSSALLITFSAAAFFVLISHFLLCIVYFIYKGGMRRIKERFYRTSNITRILIVILIILCVLFSIIYLKKWLNPIFIKLFSVLDFNNPTGRLKAWLDNFALFTSKPLFGYGLGYSSSVFGVSSLNWYLSILVETGIIGFVILMYFIVSRYRLVFRNKSFIGFLMLNSIVIIMFTNSIYYDPVIWLVFAVSGLVDKRANAID